MMFSLVSCSFCSLAIVGQVQKDHHDAQEFPSYRRFTIVHYRQPRLVVCQGWKLECVIVAGVARLRFYTAELNSGESSYPKIKC